MWGFRFGPRPSARKPSGPPADRPRDPVCGMALDPRYVEHFTEWQGVRYAFCSLTCKVYFDHDPSHYVRRDPSGGSQTVGGTV